MQKSLKEIMIGRGDKKVRKRGKNVTIATTGEQIVLPSIPQLNKLNNEERKKKSQPTQTRIAAKLKKR